MYPYASIIFLSVLCAIVTPVRAQDRLMEKDNVLALLAERDTIIIQLQHSVRELRERLAVIELFLAEKGVSDTTTPLMADGFSSPPSISSAPSSIEANPTRLTISEAASERALERTLTQTGGLLLPTRTFELVPSLSYGVSDTTFPVTAVVDGNIALGSVNLERSTSILDVTARIGLPGNNQIEIGVPYRSINETSHLSAAGVNDVFSKQTGSGTGDFRISLATTLMGETEGRPSLVGRLNWRSGGGSRHNNGITLGGGFEAWSGSLSFVKRIDPMALFWSVGYSSAQESDGIKPGNQTNVSFGTAVAMSPGSSIFGSINYQSVSESRIRERKIEETEINATSFSVGLSTILRRGMLLNVSTEIGLSEDAPDYSLMLSLPMRW